MRRVFEAGSRGSVQLGDATISKTFDSHGVNAGFKVRFQALVGDFRRSPLAEVSVCPGEAAGDRGLPFFACCPAEGETRRHQVAFR